MNWLSNLLGTQDDLTTSRGIWSTGTFGTTGTFGLGAVGSDASSGPFQEGSIVEYFSASSRTWIPAQIKIQHPDGTYDLDCKPNVTSERIRALPRTEPPIGFEIGTVVEYWSDSQGGWIPARVLGYDPRDGYSLDCKPQVPASKLRRLTPSNAEHLKNDSVVDQGIRPAEMLPTLLHPAPEMKKSAPPVATPSGSDSALFSNSYGSVQAAQHLADAVGLGAARAPRALTLPSDATPHQEGPAQLVKVSRRDRSGMGGGSTWHFEVNEEGLRALEAYGQRPVSVCTVCGPYRTGKSYLLNLLLGRVQQGSTQFRMGSTTQACTEGIWMWGAGGSSRTLGDDAALLFFDCEGFGSTEADKTRDAKLMSLCVIISSVFLLNTKGVLSEGLFNALSLVIKLAEHIEERGSEASKPALFWLLRDFVLELTDPESGRTLQPDEYLEQSLHARPLANVNEERSRAAKEVREHLLRFFPRRHCQTLVTPIVDEEKLANLSDVPYEELRPEFQREFEAVRAQIFTLAQEKPKILGGQPISGVGLARLFRRLIDALNSNKALNVSTAWDGVQHGACQSLLAELRATAVAELRKVQNGAPLPVPGGRPLPVSDHELDNAFKESRKTLKDEWRSRAVGDDEVKNEYWRDLEESLRIEEIELERANVTIAEKSLAAAGAEWSAWLSEEKGSASDPRSEALARLIAQGMPAKPCAHAVQEALHASRMARIRWDSTKQAFQDHAEEAIQRENILKEKVLEVEEINRKEQKAAVEVRQKCTEQEQTLRDLEKTVAELRRPLAQAPREVEIARGPKGHPKCGCNVM